MKKLDAITINSGVSGEILTYQFREDKLMDFLKGKFEKIKQALALSYVNENRALILETRARGLKSRIIEQEPKYGDHEEKIK